MGTRYTSLGSTDELLAFFTVIANILVAFGYNVGKQTKFGIPHKNVHLYVFNNKQT